MKAECTLEYGTDEEISGLCGAGLRRMVKTAKRGASWSVLLTKYFWVDQIKNNKIGEA
jgi:hypothetical protein